MQGKAMSEPDKHIDDGWRSKVFVPMDDIYQRMIQKGQLATVLYQHAEKHHSPQTANEMQDMIDSSNKLAQLIEDFYRNKIPEIDWEIFNDAFEEEIKAQEFRIDEAEWMSLIKALKVAQETLTAQFNSRGKDNE